LSTSHGGGSTQQHIAVAAARRRFAKHDPAPGGQFSAPKNAYHHAPILPDCLLFHQCDYNLKI
jgi:hypothetical protein